MRFPARVSASRLARLVLLYMETGLTSVKAEVYPYREMLSVTSFVKQILNCFET